MPNLYHETAEPAVAAAPFNGDARTEVAVVGAGFTGLSTALHLAERGLQVTVLEAEQPGYGASGRNGGQVNPGLKANPDAVESQFGAEMGARMNELASGGPDLVFQLIERHAIRCDARRNGTLRAAITERQARQVRDTTAQWLRRGAPVEILERSAIAQATVNGRYALAMFDRRGGDLNPLSYARGLARAAAAAGANIHGEARVLSLSKSGADWSLRTAQGCLRARQVVLATNGYTDGLWPALKRTIVPVFGAIAATEPLPDALAQSILPGRSVLYETGAITVYYRIDSQNRLLFGGRGPMHEIACPTEISPLLRYAPQLWPALKGIRWTHAWGGQLAMTTDHYPHVHEPQPGVLICLGYNGRGVALSTALGAELAGRIANPEHVACMPTSPLHPIPLHGFWRAGVQLAIARARAQEFFSF
jgi:glycine/D-amino acid oxidase-like deaminating enzyme